MGLSHWGCAVAGTTGGRLVWRSSIFLLRVTVGGLIGRRAIRRLWRGSVVTGLGLRGGSTVVCVVLRGRVAVTLLRRILALRRSALGSTILLLRVGRLLIALRRTGRCAVGRLSVCAVRRLCGQVSQVPAVHDEVTHGSEGDIDKTL